MKKANFTFRGSGGMTTKTDSSGLSCTRLLGGKTNAGLGRAVGKVLFAFLGLVAMVAISTTGAFAQTATWTGAVNSDWDNAGNWVFAGGGAFANAATMYTVPAVATQPSTVSAAFTITGASLDVTGGVSVMPPDLDMDLTFNGVSTNGIHVVAGATLTIQSGSVVINSSQGHGIFCEGTINTGGSGVLGGTNATISISATDLSGIAVGAAGTFNNGGDFGTCTINIDGVGHRGILLLNPSSTFNNGAATGAGIITIDNTGLIVANAEGIEILSGAFNHAFAGSSLDIGTGAGGIESHGIAISLGGTFTAHTDAPTINIENVGTGGTGSAIMMLASATPTSFTHTGGAITTIGPNGITDNGIELNANATLTNSGSTINIDGATGDGVLNNGIKFDNADNSTLNIDNSGDNAIEVGVGSIFDNVSGATTDIDGTTNDGILVDGEFNNGNGAGVGTVHVDGAGDDGIHVSATGELNNDAGADINIGVTTGPTGDGINNNNIVLNNAAGSTITINNTGSDGIDNQSTGTLTNDAGTITIHTSIGGDGIENTGTILNDNGGIVNIDNTDSEGINNNSPGTLTNSNSFITIGAAGAGSIAADGICNENGAMVTHNGGTIVVSNCSDNCVENDGVYTMTAGNLDIDDCGTDGIRNEDDGQFVNVFGDIDIGTITGGIGDDGIENNGDFDNGGSIDIDNAGDDGIENSDDTSVADFFNDATGTITIDGITTNGILNDETFTNDGTITIGTAGMTTIGDDGIENADGPDGAIFVNNAAITITGTGAEGVHNNGGGDFRNQGGLSTLTIDATTNNGILNDGAGTEFDNTGATSTITIGGTTATGTNGISNDNGADFDNTAAAEINIDATGTNGISNNNASDFLNDGAADIDIDGTAAAGVVNDGASTFSNDGAGSTIEIGNNGGGITTMGIHNISGLVNNSGTADITIDGTGTTGINNADDFDNISMGSITITGAGAHGILNSGTGGAAPTGFSNDGSSITISGITDDDINNTGNFTNLNAGTIALDGSDDGIDNEAGGVFTNTGAGSTITIGATTKPTDNGIENGGTFLNDASASISIMGGTSGNGVENEAGGDFDNDNGATLTIDMSGADGIQNFGDFDNGAVGASTITIGGTSAPGESGIDNEAGATFDNSNMSTVTVTNATTSGIENDGDYTNDNSTTNIDGPSAAIVNNAAGTMQSTGTQPGINSVVNVLVGGTCGTLTNAGTIIVGDCTQWNVNAQVTTTGGLINVIGYWDQQCDMLATIAATTEFVNDGVVMDRHSAFGHGSLVTNNDLIADTPNGLVVSICDQDIPNVIMNIDDPVTANLGGTAEDGNDAVAATMWFSDAALTNQVGTYDNATNTFTPTTLPMPAGTNVFFFEVDQDGFGGGCMESGPASIEVFVRPDCYEIVNGIPGINDPCECNNDAGVDSNNGTFRETVCITGPLGQELPAALTWSTWPNTPVPGPPTDVLGAFAEDVAGAPDPQPQAGSPTEGATGAAIAGGTDLTFIDDGSLDAMAGDMMGYYCVTFDHVESQGYHMFVQGPADDTDGDITTVETNNHLLDIENTCFYPEPIIIGPNLICADDEPFTLDAQDAAPGVGVWDDDADNTTAEAVSWLDGATGAVTPGATDYPGGNVTVFYHYDANDAAGTSSPGCQKTVSFTIETAPSFDPTITGLVENYCDDDLTVTLDFTGRANLTAFVATTPGDDDESDYVEWSGVGLTENANGTATFNPMDAAALGEHVICVTVGVDGCLQTYCEDVTVWDAVVATINDLHIECAIHPSGAVDLEALFAAATTHGGTFSGVGLPASGAVTGNSLVYSGAGCYQISYTVTAFAGADGVCSATDNAFVYISEEPQPSFDLPEEICWDGVSATTVNPLVNSPAYSFNGAAQAATQNWTSSNVGVATINAATGQLTVANDGTTIICLTETLANGGAACGGTAQQDCSEQVCHTFTVHQADEDVDPSWTTFGPICEGVAAVDLDARITGNANGVFTGTGVTGTHPNYEFNPAGLGGQTVAVTYTVSDGAGCTSVETHNIEVLSNVNATLDADVSICPNPTGQYDLTELFLAATTTGGTFTLQGGTGVGSVAGDILSFNPNQAFPVTYIVRYTVGNQNSCDDPDTPAAEVCTDAPADDCYGWDEATITVTDGYTVALNLPELCMPVTELGQNLNFANYLAITDATGAAVDPATLPAGVTGAWSITAYNNGAVLPDAGAIDATTGAYTPGFGSGYVQITYTLTTAGNPYNCVQYASGQFELRQPILATAGDCVCNNDDTDGTDGTYDVTISNIGGGVGDVYWYTGSGTVPTNGTVAAGNDITVTVENGEPWTVTISDSRGCSYTVGGTCEVPHLELTGTQDACTSDPVYDIQDARIFDTDFEGYNTTFGAVLQAGGPVPNPFNFDTDPSTGRLAVHYDFDLDVDGLLNPIAGDVPAVALANIIAQFAVIFPCGGGNYTLNTYKNGELVSSNNFNDPGVVVSYAGNYPSLADIGELSTDDELDYYLFNSDPSCLTNGAFPNDFTPLFGLTTQAVTYQAPAQGNYAIAEITGYDPVTSQAITAPAPAGLLTDNGNGVATVDPALAGDGGQFLVTYCVDDDPTTGCQVCTEEVINIYPSYDACFALPNPVVDGTVCNSAAAFTLAADDQFETDNATNNSFGQTVQQLSVWTMTDGQGNLWSTNSATPGPFTLDAVSGDASFDPQWFTGIGNIPGPGTYTINHYLGYDDCATECVATITIKPTVDATIENRTICGSISENINLAVMYGANTTGGGTFTLLAATNANGDDVLDGAGTPATGHVTLGGDGILTYDENGILDYTVTVQYEVGREDCEVTADNADANDCYMVSTATLTITGGHDIFLDLPEDVQCSNDPTSCDPTLITLMDKMSIEDVTWAGLALDPTPNNSTTSSLPPVPPVGTIRFDVVAADGSTDLNSLRVDGNKDGDYDDIVDFDYRSIIDMTACAGNVLSADCPVINLDRIPKDVVLTIRVTYNDGDAANGCIALAEDNIHVKPTGKTFLNNPAGPVCSSTSPINLVDEMLTAQSTICGKFNINCINMPAVDPGYTDANGNDYFDVDDPNYPNYDLAALIAALGFTPDQLYITYMVGDADCLVAMEDAILDISEQPVAFADFTYDVNCTEGMPINFCTVSGADCSGTWYGPFAVAPGAADFIPANLFAGNPLAVDPATLATGQIYAYVASGTAPCMDAVGLLTIGAISGPATPETCQYFGDGQTYDGLTNVLLQTEYCSSDAIVTGGAVPLRRVCPDSRPVLSFSNTTCDAAAATTTVSVSVPAGQVLPNAVIDDDWFIQLIYINQTDADCVSGTAGTAGVIDDPDDLDGGDHGGFEFTGTGAPDNAPSVPGTQLFAVGNNACPNTLDGFSGDNGGDVYMTAGLPGGSYDPSTPSLLAAPLSSNCSAGQVVAGSNDYFILQLTASDIYALYGGKDAFVTNFFGNNCNAASVFSLTFNSMTLPANTDLSVVFSGMDVLNYKEDTSNPDLGFTIDMTCDGQYNVGNIPTWMQLSDVFQVTAGVGPMADCFDVALDLSQLIQPDCDDQCYVFEICHTIQTCGTSCDGDGTYTYCRKVEVGKELNLTANNDYHKLGCIDASKIDVTDAALTATFEPTTAICSPTCVACPGSCAAGCFASGNWTVPDPFHDYVIDNGTDFTVLQTIVNELRPNGVNSAALDAYIATDPNYPTEGTPKRFYIPVDLTVTACPSCPDETIRRYMYVVVQPDVVLDIPDSPGVCPLNTSIIPLGTGCIWPDCVYELTLTNLSTHTLIAGSAADLMPNNMTAQTPVAGVTINTTTTPPQIEIDWAVLSAPGGFLDMAGEELFGDFTLSLTVWCGTNTYFCTDSATQNLFFLGEASANLEDRTIQCADPYNLTLMFEAGVTSGGGSFTVNGADVSGNEINVGEGTYTIGYTVGHGSCLATGSATLTVDDTIDPVFDSAPTNITVNNEPDKCGANVNWAVPTADDNCATSVAITQDAGPAPGTFFAVGTVYTITYTANDGNGNTATHTFTVTVNDMQLPDIVCPDNVTTGTDAGVCTAVVNGIAPESATDNCPTTTVTYDITGATVASGNDDASGTTFNLGTSTVTYTITDGASNTRTCSFTVTVVDDEAPAVTCPADQSVSNDAGNCSAVVNGIALTTSDNCDTNLDVSYEITGATYASGTGDASGTTFELGTSYVTYTSTDDAGNSSSCSFTVTVSDDEDPTISCPADIVVNANATGTVGAATIISNGPCGVTLSYTAPVGADNCPNPITTLTSGFGHGPNYYQYGGTYTEAYMVTDGSGNTATCSFTITVEDNVAPTIDCPADIVVPNDPGECAAVVDYANALGYDNCPDYTMSVTSGSASGSSFSVAGSPHTIEFTVTDNAGNSTSCSFTITVEDTEAPVVACPGDQVVGTDAGVCEAVVNGIDLTVSDNCDANPTITYTISGAGSGTGSASGSTFAIGTSIVTYVAEDADGNSATCNFTVTVEDDEDPTITCPADNSTLTCNDETPAPMSLADFVAAGNVGDNCGTGGLTLAYSDYENGNSVCPGDGNRQVIRTYSVTDGAGNSASCTQTFTWVEDNTAPTLSSTPADESYACSESVGVPPVLSATDNCTASSVTVEFSESITLGTCTNNYTLTRTWSATDACGNNTTHVQTITVNDNVAPTWDQAAPAATVDVSCAEDVPDAATLTASDNCGAFVDVDFSETTQPGTCPNSYSVVRTWTAEDACGNAISTTQTVNVSDTEAPTWDQATPGDESVSCSQDVPAAATLTASDNCGAPVDVEFNETTQYGDCPNSFTVVRTWSAEDDCGNAISHTQTVSVSDTEAPVLSATPADESFACPGDVTAAAVITATDNCGAPVVVEFSEEYLPGNNPVIFTLVRTWTASDDCGNTVSHTQVITVNDTENPVVDCSSGVSGNLISDGGFENGVHDQQIVDNPGAWSSFSDVPWNIRYDNTFVHSGNMAMKNFGAFTGNPNFSGIFQDASLPAVAGEVYTMSMWIFSPSIDWIGSNPNFVDLKVEFLAADGVTFLQQNVALTFDGNPADTWVEGTGSFTAPAGTATARVAAVFVNIDWSGGAVWYDDVSLVKTLSSVFTADNDPGECGAEVTIPTPPSSDNCGIVSFYNDYNLTDDATDFYPVGTTDVTWTAVDAAGNSTDCTVTVEVTDTEAPTFVNCPTTMVMVGTDVDECSAKVNWSIPIATDNCGLATLGQTGGPASGSEVAAGAPVTVTYTATDIYGNSSDCEFEVLVVDTQDPDIIVCPADRDVANDPGLCSATVPDMTGEVVFEDNCPGSVVTQSPAAGSSFGAAPGDQVVVTMTVTDAAGNTDDCEVTLTLIDTEDPNAVCQDISVMLDVFGVASVTEADIDGGSTDNCGIASIAIIDGQTSYDCSDAGNTYTLTLQVTDTSGNTDECTANVTVVDNPHCHPNVSILDPCQCSSVPGWFDEEVTVQALAGQTWTVTAVSGLHYGPNGPAVQVGDAIPPSAALGLGFYVLSGINHAAAVGYSIEVSNGLGDVLSVGNTCYNPDPFITGATDVSNQCEDPFTICGEEADGVIGDAGTSLSIDGPGFAAVANFPGPYCLTLDPSTLNAGLYTITWTFDAGLASNNNPNDPGCVITVFETFEVFNPIQELVCNDQVQISLPDVDEGCQVELTADMILEAPPAGDPVFTVWITDCIGTNLGNIVDASMLNSANCTLIANIHEECSGQSCWGTITVEDKLPPVMTCPDNIDILCVQNPENLSLTGQPTVDDCSPWTTEYSDVITQFDCAANPGIAEVITRTWLAIDAGEYTSSCTQTIQVIRGEADQVSLPGDVDFNCNAVPGDLSPNTTGWPTLGGVNLTTDGTGICGLGITYEDEQVNICPGSYKIIREWTIHDWCPANGGAPTEVEHTQYIKVNDVAPSITIPAAYFNANGVVELSANAPAGSVHDDCAAIGPIPVAVVDGVCNDVVDITVSIAGAGTTVNGGMIPGEGLPEGGPYEICYIAEDECGNNTTHCIQVVVIDDIAPTAVCDEITTVTLSSDGQIVVGANTFDDGSHDQCCLADFEVNRGFGFGPSVTFNCGDVLGDPVMVTFRAYDCAGNYNDCMVEVIVEDKLAPHVVECPGNEAITCDFYWTDLEAGLSLGDYSVLDQYGYPTFFDNCSFDVDYTVAVNVDQCGNGSIVRTWSADDPSGNGPVSCSQTISVSHVSDFEVQFPADNTFTCTNQTLDFGEPVIFNETCELIAVSHEDVLFNVVQDACYKIVRQWTVINWCNVGNPIADNLPDPQTGVRQFRDGGDGYITWEQVIKVVDDVAPVVTCADFHVDILDNSCNALVVVPGPDVEDCSSDILVTATSDLPGFNGGTFTAPAVAPGTYSVVFTAMDNCGNSNSCETIVTVADAKLPTPYCVNGLVVELMNSLPPMIEVWAADFDAGSFDNCGGVQVSLSADVNNISATFDCNDIGQQPIELWVTDVYGNQDFCTTFVEIQDNMVNCVGGNLIAGTIATEDGDTASDVDVTMNGTADGNMMTGSNGLYSFASVPSGGDYTITPANDTDHLNGVTTFDMVLITKHILGVTPLDSPYKMIAADANNSGTITTFDLVVVRKLILFIDDQFQNNTSWRFVDASYVFPEPTNPWAEEFPEVFSVNDLNQDINDADFVAVKVGDVNDSAAANFDAEAEDRNTVGDLLFKVNEVELAEGEEYTVDFKAKDFNVLGYQFTLNFDNNALEFVEILPGVAGQENFGLTLLDEGVITTSWNEQDARVEDNEVVFSLVFKAKTAATLSNLLAVNSRYTDAEAYTANGEMLDIALEFNGQVIAAPFELYQNSPNPFERTTVIGFNLPEATFATMTLTDASGKVVKVVEGDFVKGYNEVTLTRDEVPANGVIYYQLDTDTDSATKMMILMDK